MTTYTELPGSAHYEYRYEEDDKMTAWQDAGPAGDGSDNDEWLQHIKWTLKNAPYWEIRVVVSVANAETGKYAGLLTKTDRIEGGTDLADEQQA